MTRGRVLMRSAQLQFAKCSSKSVEASWASRVIGLFRGDAGARMVLGFRISAALIRALPYPVAAALGRFLGARVARRSPVRRATVAEHQRRILRRTLRREPASSEVLRSTDAVFRNAGQAWIDSCRVHRATRGELEATMAVAGWEHVAAARRTGRPVIMAMAHIGAWDRGGAWLSGRIPLTVVAERLEPPAVFDWYVHERVGAGMTVIGLDDAAGPRLLAELRGGRSIGLLCDRDLTGDGVVVSFFDAPTTMPPGPALLALRTGALVLPCAVYLQKGAVCRATILPAVPVDRGSESLRAAVVRVTQAITTEIETLICAAPDQWLVLQPRWPRQNDLASSRDGSNDLVGRIDR